MKTPDEHYWSLFWSNPTVTSFGNLFPSNYDGLMLDFWKRQITRASGKILDIACGNGAIAWIANDLTDTPNTKTLITGVDFAKIEPFTALKRDPASYPRLRFLGETNIEELPFPDSSIDLVVSQYGVEYSNLDKTIPEIARVLRDNGRMAFILHDKESVIVRGATTNLDDLKLVYNKIGLHELCMEQNNLLISGKPLNKLLRSGTFRNLEARTVRAINLIRPFLQSHEKHSPLFPYYDSLIHALNLRSEKNAARRQELIEQASERLAAHIERIDDLWRAALSDTEREQLICLVQKKGFSVSECATLWYKDGDNFGTTFAAFRATQT